MAETISIGPELMLAAAVFLLVAAVAMVAYLVGGYVAIRRVAAGSRSSGNLVLAALAVLVGLYLVVVSVASGGPYEALIPPAIHVVAAWRGWRAAGGGPTAGTPAPPPPGPPA